MASETPVVDRPLTPVEMDALRALLEIIRQSADRESAEKEENNAARSSR